MKAAHLYLDFDLPVGQVCVHGIPVHGTPPSPGQNRLNQQHVRQSIAHCLKTTTQYKITAHTVSQFQDFYVPSTTLGHFTTKLQHHTLSPGFLHPTNNTGSPQYNVTAQYSQLVPGFLGPVNKTWSPQYKITAPYTYLVPGFVRPINNIVWPLYKSHIHSYSLAPTLITATQSWLVNLRNRQVDCRLFRTVQHSLLCRNISEIT